MTAGRKAQHGFFAASAALAGALACAPLGPPPAAPAATPPPTAAPLPQAAPPTCQRITRIEVSKSARELLAFCERGALERFGVALGREPEGAKRLSGDLRTPEGSYRVSGPLRPSRFHGFLPIDYPSLADADAALAEGRIGAQDHARIVDAHARGAPPPGDTPLGGGLGLHGEGERWRGESAHLDWTYGCLALSDADLEFLAVRVEAGTPIVILP